MPKYYANTKKSALPYFYLVRPNYKTLVNLITAYCFQACGVVSKLDKAETFLRIVFRTCKISKFGDVPEFLQRLK